MASATDSRVGGAVNSQQIERAVQEAGFGKLSPEAAAQFETYLALLLKWNAKLNLTAIREPQMIVRRHFIECIQCAQAIPAIFEPRTLLDFGSGAGLPGIPIAILRPEILVTLAESQGKKAAFLKEAVRALALDAEVFQGRVEKMPPERQFPVITLRAVDKMPDAIGVAIDRSAPEGWVVLFTTSRAALALKSRLPEIEWRKELPTSGLEEGRILLGQRSH
jgi:16S rRNA (guanine527-N7)-methyltransferase